MPADNLPVQDEVTHLAEADSDPTGSRILLAVDLARILDLPVVLDVTLAHPGHTVVDLADLLDLAPSAVAGIRALRWTWLLERRRTLPAVGRRLLLLVPRS